MADGANSAANRAKSMVTMRVQCERQRQTELLGRLNRLLASTENNIYQNRRMLDEVSTFGHSEEQQLAQDSLCDLLAKNIRTKQSVQSLIEYLEGHMASMEDDVIRLSRF
jgi:hypothetical protein